MPGPTLGAANRKTRKLLSILTLQFKVRRDIAATGSRYRAGPYSENTDSSPFDDFEIGTFGTRPD